MKNKSFHGWQGYRETFSHALRCKSFGDQLGNILKFKLQIPFNLAIPFLGLYPKDIVTSAQNDYNNVQHV